MIFFLLLIIALGVVMLVVYCVYLNTLQNAVRSVAPSARKVTPGAVWLMLIPIFNLVYSFILVRKLADSFEADLLRRGQAVTGKPTYAIGLAMSVLQILYFVPLMQRLPALLGIGCWIAHWAQVAQMSRRLRALPTVSEDGSQIFSFPDGGYHQS